jgi:hypothetical protein
MIARRHAVSVIAAAVVATAGTLNSTIEKV